LLERQMPFQNVGLARALFELGDYLFAGAGRDRTLLAADEFRPPVKKSGVSVRGRVG
jgi:hypothetical protein